MSFFFLRKLTKGFLGEDQFLLKFFFDLHAETGSNIVLVQTIESCCNHIGWLLCDYNPTVF